MGLLRRPAMLGVLGMRIAPAPSVTWVSLLFFPAKKWCSGMKILPPGVKDKVPLRQRTFPLSPQTVLIQSRGEGTAGGGLGE